MSGQRAPPGNSGLAERFSPQLNKTKNERCRVFALVGACRVRLASRRAKQRKARYSYSLHSADARAVYPLARGACGALHVCIPYGVAVLLVKPWPGSTNTREGHPLAMA